VDPTFGDLDALGAARHVGSVNISIELFLILFGRGVSIAK
jgi:hypothetical protein